MEILKGSNLMTVFSQIFWEQQMRHYLDFVPISAKIHRKQSKMTRVCITLSVLLVAVMFGLADMYLQGITQHQMEESGNWHYAFHSIDTQTASFISARPEIAIAGWHNTVPSEAGYSIKQQPIAISAQDQSVFEEIFLNEMIEGEYPDTPNEIVVSSSFKNTASVSLHETIELCKPDGSATDYLVVGFFDDTKISRLMAENMPIAIMTPKGLGLLAVPNANESYLVEFSRLCNIPGTINEIKASNNLSDEQITGNIPLLSIQGQMKGATGVNRIYQVAVILSVIVMLTCILMISSSLNSNVAERTEFFGMLRCLGATKKQIMRFVCLEGLYWCKTAIPIGIIFATVTVWILSAAMRAINPQWFSSMPILGISWISIIVSALLGLLTVLLAARSPAKRAAKVSPLTAVSGNAEQTASFRKAANTKMFRVETALGIYHAKSKRRNYILMTGAFAVCIALFLTFSTLVDFMQNAFVPPAYTPELSIASKTNTCSIGSERLEQVKQNNIVKRAYGRMFAYDIPIQKNGKSYNANLISYEKNQFGWAADALADGSIETVMQQENQILFVQTGNVDVQVGDKITMSINGSAQTVTVAGILSDSPLARAEGTETFFCSEKTFTALTGETGYTIIDVQFKNGASSEDVKAIEKVFPDGSVIFSDNLSQIQQQRNLYHTFAVLVYGFLSIIVAITVFHIMNTINMGVTAKMKEYGSMRAIGMSDRQLIKMITAEAGSYAISGVIWGVIIGLPMHWVIYVSLITNIWGRAWGVPFIPLVFIIAVILFACLLAVREPAKRLQRMSVVENISAQ